MCLPLGERIHVPDIMLLRTVFPDIPIVHYMPTFPTSYDSWLREKLQISLFRRGMYLVNGFIAGSERMKRYLTQSFGIDDDSIFVGPIFYTSEYFAKKNLPPLSTTDHEPHLVCTGSTVQLVSW